MKNINILGAGISGLSAAHYLLKKVPESKIRIFEASQRVGGWIKSRKVDKEVIFQQSARTIRPTGVAGLNTLELVQDLDLFDRVVPITRSHPAAQNRMIYANGKLHLLPNKLTDIVKKMPPFSKPLVALLANDLFAKKVPKNDESIYDFVARRFGTEVADYLISPLICGICAGSAKEISVKFLMEPLFEKEQKYGSISMGLIFDTLKLPFKSKMPPNPLQKLVRDQKWSVYTFREGLNVISETLEKSLSKKNVGIHLGVRCRELNFKETGVEVLLDDFSVSDCDHLISSISAENLSYLLDKQHPDLSAMLRKIPMVTVAVVNLHYKKKLPIPDAFGFLVPPSENLPILGVIFDSSCSFDRNNTVLTVMLGGKWFEQYFGNLDTIALESAVLDTSITNLQNILEISDKPDNYAVNILRDCIPQYVVGHKENVKNIEEYIEKKNLPLSLCGFSYYGVGVNDAILSAKSAVTKL